MWAQSARGGQVFEEPVSLTWLAWSIAVSLIVAFFLRQRGWSIALPLIFVGMILGRLPFGPSAPLRPELVLTLILAPLVFGEALGSSYLDMRRARKPVLALAIGLVLVGTLAVGWAAHAALGIPLALACALGAVLSPTDAVAVSAVARRANLPHRIVSVLEGESLVNDGTGLTLLRVAITLAVAGTVTAWDIGETLVLSVVGGVVVGLIGGWILAQITRRSRDAIAANALVLIAPFALYGLAEIIEGSGILAVVIAALMLAHSNSSTVRLTGRVQTGAVWRQVTFLLQALAFFLVGLELQMTVGVLSNEEFRLVGILTGICVAVLIVARLVFAYAMSGIGLALGWAQRKELGRTSFIIGWAGARGPVSGLAVFSIPLVLESGEPLPYRSVLLATTFCVILVTLLLAQTIGPVARLLRVTPDDQGEASRRINVALALAGLRRLELAEAQALDEGVALPPHALAALRRTLQARAQAVVMLDPEATDSGMAPEELAHAVIEAEQEELIRIRDSEGLPDTVFRAIQRQLDLRMQSLGPH